jgi:hypothetical protein
MKSYRTYARRGLLAAAALTALFLTPFAARAQKMTPEELVAKHLASVGTAEARAAVKSRLMAGRVVLTLRSGTGQNTGLAVLFSQGKKSVIGMSFSNPKYPHDKFGYNGQNVTISYIQPGVRSELGDFIQQREQLIKLGLLGGALSSNWALAGALDESVAKLEYAGTGKVDGKPAHKLRYNPRKGSDLKITLFFDQETFRHVRTEYEQVVSGRAAVTPGGGLRGQAPQGAPGVDASKEFQRELRLKMVEEFSDFKEVGGLTLPHTYEISLDLDRQLGGKYQAEWKITLEKFDYNQALKEEWFDVNATNSGD